MAIGATEHCNPCDNADDLGRRHVHEDAEMCGRRMYGGDFFCTCREPNAIVRPIEPKGQETTR